MVTPVPGEARITRVLRRLVLIQDVTLGFEDRQARADAILDTGATHCMVPREIVGSLGLRRDDRLGVERVQPVAGRTVTTGLYRLARVQVGTARAYDVDFLVGDTLAQFMLLGMSFIERFQTTLDLDAERVIFRLRSS